jgi:hypothetical protein
MQKTTASHSPPTLLAYPGGVAAEIIDAADTEATKATLHATPPGRSSDTERPSVAARTERQKAAEAASDETFEAERPQGAADSPEPLPDRFPLRHLRPRPAHQPSHGRPAEGAATTAPLSLSAALAAATGPTMR